MTDNKLRTCYFCGKEGVLGDDIHEEITHIGKEHYVWGCKDINACIDRQIQKGLKPSYYRKTEEVVKQENDFAMFQSGIKQAWQVKQGG